MSLHPFDGTLPTVSSEVWIAPSADVIGDVTIGPGSTVFYGAVLRGDIMPIRVGARTSIQDNCVLHTTDHWQACVVGDECTVGHGAILHGCTVRDRVVVGMGSILLDEADIGEDVILGAGSLVTARTRIPPGVLAFGRPAAPVRDLTDAELASIRESAEHYALLLASYAAASR